MNAVSADDVRREPIAKREPPRTKPREETLVHTRMMKCALEVEEARAYWQHADGSTDASPKDAFDHYWFGARSMPRVKVLLVNMRARFDAFPPAPLVLHRWTPMSPDTRKLICHWHLQLSDPLYRQLTGDYFEERRQGLRAEVTRDLIARWVSEHGPARWSTATHLQLASKLLSASHASGLVTKTRDPRPLAYPRVTDEALEYLMYLLRDVEFEGSLTVNPYLASVGLTAGFLEDRLRALPSLRFSRQGELVDFGWRHDTLADWADARVPSLAGAR